MAKASYSLSFKIRSLKQTAMDEQQIHFAKEFSLETGAANPLPSALADGTIAMEEAGFSPIILFLSLSSIHIFSQTHQSLH